MTPHLTPLLRERQFYAAILVGLPGLLYGYVEIGRALLLGEQPDIPGVAAMLGANPIVLYLLGRQYARGKSVEAAGQQPRKQRKRNKGERG